MLNYDSSLEEKRIFVLIIVLATMISFVLASLDFPPISKLVSDQFDLTNAQVGLATSFFFVPYAAMQIPGGYFSDRFGSARILLASTFVMALAPLLFIYGGSLDTLFASRLIAGASGGVVFPSMVRLLSQSFPKSELSRAMGFFGSAYGAGQLIASSLLPLLVLGIDWRPPLLATVAYSLVTTCLLIFPARWAGPPILGGLANPSQKVQVRGLFTKNMFALMLPNFASLAVVFGSYAWASDFLITHFDISNSVAGSIVALIGVSTIVGSYSGGISERVLGGRLTIGISMFLLFLFTLLFGFARSLPEAATLLLGVGFGANLYFATDFSLIPYASEQGLAVAGIAFGVFNTLSNIGSVIAPFFFGVILDVTGSFSLGFGLLAVIALFGIVGAFLLSLKSLH